ncbi:MAG: hypothetical protein IPH13_15450 [Planctomycetes bacterium]|nr:hypothetical protein [Planctomycetota bacterium]
MRRSLWSLGWILAVVDPLDGTTIDVAAGSSIQAAIDAAAPGDTITVANATYFETVVIDRSLTLIAADGATIDATGLGASALRILGVDASGAMIDGFVIRGGLGSPVQNVTERAGGGALIVDASPIFRACTFVDNDGAMRGGGAYAYGSVLGQQPTPRFVDCVFAQNSANEGGAYADLNVSAQFVRCTFRDNAAIDAGALHSAGAHDLVLDRCWFERNSASSAGGALVVAAYDASRTRIMSSCFVDNAAGVSGGAIAVFGHPPLAAGGGLHVESTLIARNRAFYGGGIAATENGELGTPLMQVLGATITDNLALGHLGGGISTVGGTIASASIVRSIVQGNQPADLLVIGFVADSCVGAPTPGPGNYVADPGFVDAANGDYHLRTDSPCIDRGSLFPIAATIDIEGDPRIVGSKVDTGADEFFAHAYFLGHGEVSSLRVIGTANAAVHAWFAPSAFADATIVVGAPDPIAAMPLGTVGPFALGVANSAGTWEFARRVTSSSPPLFAQVVVGTLAAAPASSLERSAAAPGIASSAESISTDAKFTGRDRDPTRGPDAHATLTPERGTISRCWDRGSSSAQAIRTPLSSPERVRLPPAIARGLVRGSTSTCARRGSAWGRGAAGPDPRRR